MNRRLPIFLVLDIYDSMVGEPHRYLQQGLTNLIKNLRQNPYALDSVHLSVIVFAGKVDTLVPLIDLATFYSPQLPIGAGTALGATLTHLMTEIDHNIVPTTFEQKGDWKPIVYLFTDGKPTDNYKNSIQKWLKYYAKRTQIIAVGLGKYADTTILSQFADQTLRYTGENEDDFARFIDWISVSVGIQSSTINLQENDLLPVSLEKTSDILALNDRLVTVDQNYVILVSRCQSTGIPYLLKYEKVTDMTQLAHLDLTKFQQPLYYMDNSFPVTEDYFTWSDDSIQTLATVNINQLIGQANCPHCCNYNFGRCVCGKLFCADEHDKAQCPWCQQRLVMNNVDIKNEKITIERSLG